MSSREWKNLYVTISPPFVVADLFQSRGFSLSNNSYAIPKREKPVLLLLACDISG